MSSNVRRQKVDLKCRENRFSEKGRADCGSREGRGRGEGEKGSKGGDKVRRAKYEVRNTSALMFSHFVLRSSYFVFFAIPLLPFSLSPLLPFSLPPAVGKSRRKRPSRGGGELL